MRVDQKKIIGTIAKASKNAMPEVPGRSKGSKRDHKSAALDQQLVKGILHLCEAMNFFDP